MKIDVKKIKPVFSPNDRGVLDPPRYPKVIIPYEKKMKASFAETSNRMISKITQKMVEIKK